MVTIIGASVTIAPFGTRFFNRRYIGRLILGAMAFGVAPVLTFALVVGIAGRIGANEIFLGAGIMGIAGLLSVSLKLAGAYARGGDDEDRLLRLPRFGGRAFRVAGAAVIGLTLVVAAWSWTYVRSLEPRSFWLFMAVCAATLGCGLDIFSCGAASKSGARGSCASRDWLDRSTGKASRDSNGSRNLPIRSICA
jgi:hypothetical protein